MCICAFNVCVCVCVWFDAGKLKHEVRASNFVHSIITLVNGLGVASTLEYIQGSAFHIHIGTSVHWKHASIQTRHNIDLMCALDLSNCRIAIVSFFFSIYFGLVFCCTVTIPSIRQWWNLNSISMYFEILFLSGAANLEYWFGWATSPF